MITAAPESNFEARVDGFPPNLTVEVGVRILDNLGGVELARTTRGILEDPAGSGSYTVTLAAPTFTGQYTIFWDWDNGGPLVPAHTASEDLVVEGSRPRRPGGTPVPGGLVDAVTPHLAVPLRYAGGRIVVNEQDSYEDIRDCVRTIVSFPTGSRIEMPDFGIPDQAFLERGGDPPAVRAAVERWEPRAQAAVEADNADLFVLISRLNLELKEKA